MSDVAEMTLRHAAALARIGEAAERLAMKHVERALAADDPEVEASANAAFHRAARSMRQCFALEAKLVRDAQHAERESLRQAEGDATRRRERRRGQVRAHVERLIWTEAESDESAQQLCSELDDLIDIETFNDDFAEDDVEAVIARICGELGLTVPGPAPLRADGDSGVPSPPPALRSSA